MWGLEGELMIIYEARWETLLEFLLVGSLDGQRGFEG